MRLGVIASSIEAAWPHFPVPWHRRSPAVLAARRMEMDRLAAPVRELFDLLESGEVFDVGGRPVMRSPDADYGWVEVAPMLGGWIDCLQRLAPDLPCRALSQLLRFLQAGTAIPPRLVASARAEFEPQTRRVVCAQAAEVRSAMLRAQLAWEVERLGLGGAEDALVTEGFDG